MEGGLQISGWFSARGTLAMSSDPSNRDGDITALQLQAPFELTLPVEISDEVSASVGANLGGHFQAGAAWKKGKLPLLAALPSNLYGESQGLFAGNEDVDITVSAVLGLNLFSVMAIEGEFGRVNLVGLTDSNPLQFQGSDQDPLYAYAALIGEGGKGKLELKLPGLDIIGIELAAGYVGGSETSTLTWSGGLTLFLDDDFKINVSHQGTTRGSQLAFLDAFGDLFKNKGGVAGDLAFALKDLGLAGKAYVKWAPEESITPWVEDGETIGTVTDQPDFIYAGGELAYTRDNKDTIIVRGARGVVNHRITRSSGRFSQGQEDPTTRLIEAGAAYTAPLSADSSLNVAVGYLNVNESPSRDRPQGVENHVGFLSGVLKTNLF